MNCERSFFGKKAVRLEGHKASRSSQKDCRENAPTPTCLALYLTLRTRGYAAWERIKEVSDTTGNLKEWWQSY